MKRQTPALLAAMVKSPRKYLLSICFILLTLAFVANLFFSWRVLMSLVLYQDFPDALVKSGHCSMASCINWDRCRTLTIYSPPADDPMWSAAHVSALKLRPCTSERDCHPLFLNIMRTLQSSRYWTNNSDEACLFFPPFSTLCYDNDCSPNENLMPYALRQLPGWNNGRNWAVLEISDHPHLPFEAGDALHIRSAWSQQHYRDQFDLAIPLFAKRRFFWNETIPILERPLLASFKGTVSETKRDRLLLRQLHDNRTVVVLLRCNLAIKTHHALGEELCTELKQDYSAWGYQRLLEEAQFGIVMKGQGLHSYRLLETLGAGAIPVIVADDFVLPFADCLDWSTFSLRLRESQLLQLPDLVRAIPSEQMIRMQENALAAYRRYFANTSLVVLKSLEILERRFNVSQGRLVQPC